jgi:hypothetical protein
LKATVRLPFEGTFHFNVNVSNCCEEQRSSHVDLSLICRNDFTVDAGADVTYDLLPFGFPWIRLSGSVNSNDAQGDEIHFSWRIVEWPFENGTVWTIKHDMVLNPPELFYQYSLTPYFHATYVGTYTLELLAFDGCHFATDRVKVSIGCINPDYRLDMASSSTIWDGYSFGYQTASFENCHSADVNPIIDTNVFLKEPFDPLFQIKKGGTDGSPQWSVFYSDAINYTIQNFSSYPQPDSETIAPVSSVKNGMIRAEAERYFVEEKTNVVLEEEENISYVGSLTVPHCYLYGSQGGDRFSVSESISISRENVQQDSLPWWSVNNPDLKRMAEITAPYYYGICEGVYTVAVTIGAEEGCTNQTESFDIDVSCGAEWIGPLCKPLVPCNVVMFDYGSDSFPPVAVWDDSSDRNGRNIYPHVPDEVVVNPNLTTYSYDGSTLRTDFEGTFTITRQITDGCLRDEEVFEVRFECATDVALTLSYPTSLIEYNYSDPFDTVLFTADAKSLGYVRVDWYYVLGDVETYVYSYPTFEDTHETLAGFDKLKVVASDNCRETVKYCNYKFQCQNIDNFYAIIGARYNVTAAWNSFLPEPQYSSQIKFESGCQWDEVQPDPHWVFSDVNGTIVQTFDSWNGTLTLNFPPGDYVASMSIIEPCQSMVLNHSFSLVCTEIFIEIEFETNSSEYVVLPSTQRIDVYTNVTTDVGASFNFSDMDVGAS